MFFRFLFRPRDWDVEAWDQASPFCRPGMPVMPDRAVDELLDDYVAGFAFVIGERVNEADGIEGHRLFDGADGAFVGFVIVEEHPFRDRYINLEIIRYL